MSLLIRALIPSWEPILMTSCRLITSRGPHLSCHHTGGYGFYIWIWGDIIQPVAQSKVVKVKDWSHRCSNHHLWRGGRTTGLWANGLPTKTLAEVWGLPAAGLPAPGCATRSRRNQLVAKAGPPGRFARLKSLTLSPAASGTLSLQGPRTDETMMPAD